VKYEKIGIMFGRLVGVTSKNADNTKTSSARDWVKSLEMFDVVVCFTNDKSLLRTGLHQRKAAFNLKRLKKRRCQKTSVAFPSVPE